MFECLQSVSARLIRPNQTQSDEHCPRLLSEDRPPLGGEGWRHHASRSMVPLTSWPEACHCAHVSVWPFHAQYAAVSWGTR